MALKTYMCYTRCDHCGVYDRDPQWCDLCGRPKEARSARPRSRQSVRSRAGRAVDAMEAAPKLEFRSEGG
jgi:hypothetical protein